MLNASLASTNVGENTELITETRSTDVTENATPMIQSIGRGSINGVENDTPMIQNIERITFDVAENGTPITENVEPMTQSIGRGSVNRAENVNKNYVPIIQTINSARH
ncbi:MAG: hypothetical protein EBV86_12650 [Marivivens sp.]|nr:hypothetical protein [Marivivens sp.]